MDASDVLRALTILTFAGVAVAASRQRRQEPGSASTSVFVGFTVLTLVSATLALLPDEATTQTADVIRRVTLGALPFFPYLLFRFTVGLAPAPRWLEWLARALTALAVASALLPGAPSLAGGDRSAVYLVPLLLQWVVLSVATTVRLWRAGRDEPTVARRRIRTFAVACIGITVTLLVAGAAEDAAIADVVIRLLALASAVLFLLSLAPPPQLRALWRKPEEARLRSAIADLMSARTTGDVTSVLLACVAGLLGGRGAALLGPDGEVLASHGAIDATQRLDRARAHVVDASEGRVAVFTSPYTPLFGQEEFGLLASVTGLADLAYQRCNDRHIAETLQRSLLPQKLPAVPGHRIATRYLPAGEGAVGGDWYDVLALPDGRFGLVIGDVMGHGVDAAALMGQLRSALRAYALDAAGPEHVLARLDRFVQSLGRGAMATVLYVTLDRRTSTVRFASAGHLPPVLRRSGQRAALLEADIGPPLGIGGAITVPTTVALDPGALLVLFTDGLIERRGEAITDGIARLTAAVDAARGGSDDVCDHLVRDLVPSGATSDDVALLVLEGANPASGRRA